MVVATLLVSMMAPPSRTFTVLSPVMKVAPLVLPVVTLRVPPLKLKVES